MLVSGFWDRLLTYLDPLYLAMSSAWHTLIISFPKKKNKVESKGLTATTSPCSEAQHLVHTHTASEPLHLCTVHAGWPGAAVHDHRRGLRRQRAGDSRPTDPTRQTTTNPQKATERTEQKLDRWWHSHTVRRTTTTLSKIIWHFKNNALHRNLCRSLFF